MLKKIRKLQADKIIFKIEFENIKALWNVGKDFFYITLMKPANYKAGNFPMIPTGVKIGCMRPGKVDNPTESMTIQFPSKLAPHFIDPEGGKANI